MRVFGIHTGGVALERGSTNGSESAAARRGSPRRPLQLLLAAMVLVVGAIPFLPQSAGAAPAVTLPTTLHNPPVTGQIISFPARDFISADGWGAFPLVDVQVFRHDPNGGAADFLELASATVEPAGGLVEVNHPGGACWAPVTPNIVAGDVVMLTAKNTDGSIIVQDATTTANVTITEKSTEIAPGTVEVRGRALTALGGPIPSDQLEMRLIGSAQDRFDLNNRRDLRAPRDGTFTIAPNGDWVATISGLGTADVARALAAENRVVWLGANPAAGVESTIFEVGDAVAPGPAAPCTAPLQAAVAAPSSTQIDFPATEVNTISAPISVTLANAGAGVLADLLVSAITVTGIDSADFHVTDTCIGVPVAVGSSCNLSVTFSPTTTGSKSALLQIQSNAGNSIVAINAAGLATGVNEQVALGVARPAFLGFATRSEGNTSPAESVDIKNIGNAPMTVTGLSVVNSTKPNTAAAATDYTILASSCAAATVNPGASCTVNVVFTPHGQGNRDATLKVDYNGPVQPPASVTVDLTGGGLITTNIVPFDQFGTVGLGVFTARDFVSNGGFDPEEVITSQIIRSGVVIAQGTTPAGLDGIAEINHPGGGCWIPTTPNIRAGDVLRVTRADGRIYEMTTADVKVTAHTVETDPGVVVMKGYARDLTTGGPIPLDQIEARIIGTSRDPFAINGKRSLRTGGEGILAYDTTNNPDGINWTATWDLTGSPDVAHDVALAIAEENRILWLGRNPLALSEMTFWEDDPAVVDGPSAPCTAPGQAPSPGIAILPAAQTFPAMAIANGATAAESSQRTFSIRNIGNAPLTVNSITFAGANPGDFTLVNGPTAAIAPDGVANFTVRFSPQGSAIGDRTATVVVNDNSIGGPHTATVSGKSVATSQPAALVNPTSLTFPDTRVGVTSPAQTLTVTNEGGQPLDFTSLGITGTNLGNFAIDAGASTCAVGTPVVNSATCTIAVTFTPSDVNGRSATLNIASNDPAGAQHIPLSGISTTTADGTFDPPRAPHDVQAFPVRDYVAAAGYTPTERVVMEVYRNGNLIARSEEATPVDTDPTDNVFDGLVEVNHAGGVGWVTETPDILPGDVVRAVRFSGAGGTRLSADQTHVANLSVTMPATKVADGVVVMTGTAADPYTGLPLVPGSIEPRITKPLGAPLFDVNGRRDLRGGLDGVVTWNGTQWTATFSGLSLADVDAAVAGDSKVVWLGRVPLNLSELTHWEWNEIPGPDPAFAATAPFHVQEPTVSPATLSLGFAGVGTQSSVVDVTFRNSANANPTNLAYDPSVTPTSVGIVGLHAGDFQILFNDCGTAPTPSLAPNATCTVRVYLQPTAVGLRFASLRIAHNGANAVSFVPLAGIGVAAPTITSLTSPVGRGDVMHIVGTNLLSTSSVTVGGPIAQFTVLSDTAVDVVVPNVPPNPLGGNLNASVVLNAVGGSFATSTVVRPDPPVIDTWPATVKVGDPVTITGSNLAGATVTFNGVAGTNTTSTAGTINTIVPAGATSGLLTVSTLGGVASKSITVQIVPVITGFTPATARTGATITVTGAGFAGLQTVSFRTAASAAFPGGGSVNGVFSNLNAAGTSFRVIVPTTAVQGPIIVTTTSGSGSRVFTVERAPSNITAAPTSGVIGSTVTLKGENFLTTSKVSFNGRGATFTVVDAQTIRATVPGGATTGTISVNNKWGSANSPTFTVIQPPTVTGFTPAQVTAAVRTVTITGTNLSSVATAVLVRGTATPVTVSIVTASPNAPTATRLQFTVPAGIPLGLYTIRVTNPAGTVSSVSSLNVVG